MTLRELIIKILETISNALKEVSFFFEDVGRKIEAEQFLELTVNQVGIIAGLIRIIRLIRTSTQGEC